MENRLHRLATDEQGHVHLYYALALLAVAIVSQPAVALGILYQLETLARMFVGQLVSLL